MKKRYPKVISAEELIQKHLDQKRCEHIFKSVTSKLEEKAEQLKILHGFGNDPHEPHEKFSSYLPDMSIFEVIHEDLEVFTDVHVYFTFQGLGLGRVIYDYETKRLQLAEDVTFKTDKNEDITFKRILEFDDLLHVILDSYGEKGESIEKVELIFQKMEFETC